MSLREIAPTIDALLAMDVDELGLRMLPLLIRPTLLADRLSMREFLGRDFGNAFNGVAAFVSGPRLYPGREAEAVTAVIEAWMWLECDRPRPEPQRPQSSCLDSDRAA